LLDRALVLRHAPGGRELVEQMKSRIKIYNTEYSKHILDEINKDFPPVEKLEALWGDYIRLMKDLLVTKSRITYAELNATKSKMEHYGRWSMKDFIERKLESIAQDKEHKLVGHLTNEEVTRRIRLHLANLLK